VKRSTYTQGRMLERVKLAVDAFSRLCHLAFSQTFTGVLKRKQGTAEQNAIESKSGIRGGGIRVRSRANHWRLALLVRKPKQLRTVREMNISPGFESIEEKIEANKAAIEKVEWDLPGSY